MKWLPWRRRPAARPIRPRVRLHEAVLTPTLLALRASRSEEEAHEGIVYWAGTADDETWVITTCIVPEAVTTRGSFRTSAGANARVVRLLASANLVLLGQVHSHPGSLVDHSAGDDRDALMPYENFLSVVVPNYGKASLWPLDECGVHRFEHEAFRRLTRAEVTAQFQVIPTFLQEKGQR